MRGTWWSLIALTLSGVYLAGCQSATPTSSLPSEALATRPTVSQPPPLPTLGPAASAATTGRLTLVGRLATLRAAHTATALTDGRVLIAGGCTEDSCEGITATTELLDPATAASTPGPDMLQRRVGHAALPLPDGRVLMIGGFQEGTQTATTEIFDPASNAFTQGPNLLEALADPVAVVLRDGSVLVACGFSAHTSIASAEVLDAGLTAFRSTDSLSTARSSHGGALLPDGRVIVIGGNTRGDTGTVLASSELYDPTTGTWSAGPDMSTPRHKLAVVALADGRVLVLGGSNQQDAFGQHRSAEIYDPGTVSFARTGDMTAARYKVSGAVVLLADGRVLVAGGSRRAEVYDPASGSFQPVGGGVNVGFSFSAAARRADGSVLVSGGYDSGIHLTDQILRFVP